MNCASCKHQIARGELLSCSTCNLLYHYRCMNITSSYYVENKSKLSNSWRCPSCKNITRQNRTDVTPVRRHSPSTFDDTIMSVDDQIQDDQSILGNTKDYDSSPIIIDNPTVTSPAPLTKETITLRKISELLDKKLELQHQSILSTIRDTVQSEINKAVSKFQQEISQRTEQFSLEQTKINTSISLINEKIKKLDIENTKLKTDIAELRNKNMHVNVNDTLLNDTSKTFVIHGLNEYYNETEKDMEDRILFAFQDTLNVDLTGYIEGLNRIGRNGLRRPLRVELISKRMTKYILESADYLKSLGLSVSEYLDKETLQKRKKQREERFILHQNTKAHNMTVDGSTRKSQTRIHDLNITRPTYPTQHNTNENRTFRNSRPTI